MPKRKSKATPNGDVSDSDSDTSLLNVDFDFFPPHERDYHGLKSLLTQLLHTSSKSLPVNELADAIIDQPVLGTCVKCEDEEHTAEENDPFAFLACVDLWDRREEAGTKRTVEWLRRKCEGEKGLEGVRGLLEGMREERRVGLVLAERLINMPPAVSEDSSFSSLCGHVPSGLGVSPRSNGFGSPQTLVGADIPPRSRPHSGDCCSKSSTAPPQTIPTNSPTSYSFQRPMSRSTRLYQIWT